MIFYELKIFFACNELELTIELVKNQKNCISREDMSASKDSRLAYFKDNYQDPTDDEFDPTQYYYKRQERNGGDLDSFDLVNGVNSLGYDMSTITGGTPYQASMCVYF